MKNIILIGMPGSGKTYFGQKAAEIIQCDFFDADATLEELEAKSIADFFAESEESFRDAETRTVEYLSGLKNCIIAMGGGVVKRARNMELLRNNGIIVFINRSPEKIVTDINTGTRPLLVGGKQKIFALYNERIDLYLRYQDYIVMNEGDREDTLQALLKIIRSVQA